MTLKVLIADDEYAARYGMAKVLAKVGCEIIEAEQGEQALELIRNKRPDLVFLDLTMPRLDGLSLLRRLAEDNVAGEIIVVTADDSIEKAVECMKLGAADYLTKPYEIERVRAIARRNQRRVRTEDRVVELHQQLNRQTAFGALLGVSAAMQALFAKLPRAARAPLDILLVGETGTGKELIAREIHRISERADKPFVAVNSAAVHDGLAESLFFGHVKGAFTGALSDRAGFFEQANGGTIFLDEIGDMPPELQSKLLRVLQERTVQAVGSSRQKPVDVRVISATHQDLRAAVHNGDFREDLYYRVRGIELQAPALRERPEDVPLLARFFLEQLADQSRRPPFHLTAAALQKLLRHDWPGNVRELRQAVSAAGAMSENAEICAADLMLDDGGKVPDPQNGYPAGLPDVSGLSLTDAKNKLTAWFEATTIRTALSDNHGNVSAAARQLGIHRQSLQQKMQQLGIERDGV